MRICLAVVQPILNKIMSPPNEFQEMCHLLRWAKEHCRHAVERVIGSDSGKRARRQGSGIDQISRRTGTSLTKDPEFSEDAIRNWTAIVQESIDSWNTEADACYEEQSFEFEGRLGTCRVTVQVEDRSREFVQQQL